MALPLLSPPPRARRMRPEAKDRGVVTFMAGPSGGWSQRRARGNLCQGIVGGAFVEPDGM